MLFRLEEEEDWEIEEDESNSDFMYITFIIS